MNAKLIPRILAAALLATGLYKVWHGTVNVKASMVVAALAFFVAQLYKLCHAIVNTPSEENEDDHGTQTIP